MSGEDLGRRLLDLKEQLEKQKQKRAEMQGELKSMNRRLEKEFGLDSVDAAEKYVEREEVDLQSIQEAISEKIDELEEMMLGDD